LRTLPLPQSRSPGEMYRGGFATGGPLELVRAVTGAQRVPLRKVRCTPSLRRVRRSENAPSARTGSRKSLDIYPGGRKLAVGVFEAAKFVGRSGGVDVERCAERGHGGRVRIQWCDLGCRVQRWFVPRKFIVRVVLRISHVMRDRDAVSRSTTLDVQGRVRRPVQLLELHRPPRPGQGRMGVTLMSTALAVPPTA
jgi:hypothetical protein